MHSHAKSTQATSRTVFIDDSQNQGYLDIEYHHLPRDLSDGEPILKVKVPGDGNCGLYSIALGLINLIVQDKLVLSNSTYNEFLGFMRKDALIRIVNERVKYYKDGIPIDGKRVRLQPCLPHIDRIIKALNENKLSSFAQFKRFLLNYNDYYEVLSLVICMAPALRALTNELNAKLPQYPFTQYLGVPIIEPENRDGKDTSFEQLKLLESFFGFHLKGYNNMHEELGSNFPNQQTQVNRAASSSTSSSEKKSNSQAAEGSEELDPLLQRPITNRRGKATTTSMSISSAHHEEQEEEAKESDSVLIPNPMPTMSIVHSDSPGHFDLLLPISDYLSPPFYFGFSFANVTFDLEAQKEKQQMPASLASIQIALAHEKKRIQQFRQEIIKLKIAVSALSNKQEFETGRKLAQVLESNINALFTPKTASVENLQIQQNAFVLCSTAVREAHERLKKNSPSVANILANLGLFIATLGVGYLVAGAIHYAHTGRIGFFNKPSSLLRNELPVFSQKFVELHKERGSHPSKEAAVTLSEPIEELPPLPPLKEWSKMRI